MHIFLFILFLILGTAGLIYKVDTGVFVGFSLIPWELIQLGYEKISLAGIILCVIIGIIFFIMIHDWVLLLLFILVQFYNIWGYYKKFKVNPEEEKETSL